MRIFSGTQDARCANIIAVERGVLTDLGKTIGRNNQNK